MLLARRWIAAYFLRMTHATDDRPILFAFDGSDHAKTAMRVAAAQLSRGRRALVLSVWHLPAGLLLAPSANATPEIEQGKEREALTVAEDGAEVARSLGFDARPLAVPGVPVWSGIVNAADEHDVDLIVMGSHGRTGVALAVIGSVAEAVTRHTDRPVLIVHAKPERAAA